LAITDRNSGPRPRLAITHEIIDRAARKDSGHCVIADAIKTQIPNATAISVDLATVRWSDRTKGERYVFLTPEAAQRILLAFDQGWPIAPQRLRFRPPTQILIITNRGNRATASAPKREMLRAKEAAGQRLSASERRSLALYRQHEARMGGNHIEDRPTAAGSVTTKLISDDDHCTQLRGGEAPPRAVLAHGRGQRRQWGVRVAGLPDDTPTTGVRS
jgi:hypothetical protein